MNLWKPMGRTMTIRCVVAWIIFKFIQPTSYRTMFIFMIWSSLTLFALSLVLVFSFSILSPFSISHYVLSWAFVPLSTSKIDGFFSSFATIAWNIHSCQPVHTFLCVLIFYVFTFSNTHSNNVEPFFFHTV